jgi:hypothetical protein
MPVPIYTPNGWVDDDGSGTVGTVVTAARMNGIEQAVADASVRTRVVRLASSANVNIANPPAAIDNTGLQVGNRILLLNQTNAVENGIYVYNGAGQALTRAADMANGSTVLAGQQIFISNGAAYFRKWYMVAADNVIGQFNMTFVPMPQKLDIYTQLPPLAYDGMECLLLVDQNNGITWHLRYRAFQTDNVTPNPSAYKWEVVGSASDLFAEVETGENKASNGAISDLATVGPSLTIPVSGDYDFLYGMAGSANGGGAGAPEAYCYLNINGVTDNTSLATLGFNNVSSGTTSAMRSKRKTAMVANQVVKLIYGANNTGGSMFLSRRWIRARPIRVG